MLGCLNMILAQKNNLHATSTLLKQSSCHLYITKTIFMPPLHNYKVSNDNDNIG